MSDKVNVGAKLTHREKLLLEDSGHNAREAIKFFLDEYYKKNPNKKAFAEHSSLNKEIEDLEKKQRAIMVEMEAKKIELEAVKDKLGYKYVSESDRMDQILNNALKEVQKRYDEKKSFLNDVFELGDEFFMAKARNCGMDLSEFKELVVDYIE